jgi:hypothetical protein
VAVAVAVAVAVSVAVSVVVAVGAAVGSSLSPRLGERVGLGSEAVREGSTLAVTDPGGEGSAIEPSPSPQEVSISAAASPSGTASFANRRWVAIVLGITRSPPVIRAVPAPASAWGITGARSRNAIRPALGRAVERCGRDRTAG